MGQAQAERIKLTGSQHDTLVALVERGPLYDGDLPSKIARDELVEKGLAIQILHRGSDGYTAATLEGGEVFKRVFGNAETIAEAQRFRKLGQPS